MVVQTVRLDISTKCENDVVDLTDEIRKVVSASSINSGLVCVFVSGSTAAITMIEFEAGLIKDFVATLSRIAPADVVYEHDKRWQDGNGRSHVKASLIGPDLVVPLNNGKLELGTWQRIVLVEFDLRPRRRSIIIQIIGE